MTLEVVSPTKDEEKLKALGAELLEAGKELGFNFDPKGFLESWIAGVRVIVEKDNTGKVVGMLLLVAGQRWVSSDTKATVLDYRGNKDRLIDFAISIAKAIGASGIFIEEDEPLEKTEQYSRFVIKELNLE